jgi:glycosyltransferase involved in cell wall biosynthesis
MKPYVLVSGDFVTTGGMDRANYALADYLARKGHPVHLVANRVASDLVALPTVRWHAVAKPANSYFLGEFLLARRGKALGRQLAREGGRVVVNGGNCCFEDVNWVHYVHAAYRAECRASWPWRFKQWVAHETFLRGERQALKKARLVLANSQTTRTDLVNRLGLPHDKVRVLYYGIDADRFRPVGMDEKRAMRDRLGWPADRPLAAFIGALGDRRKGFDTLFEAWRLLCASPGWDVDLVVIGTGPEFPVWVERAKAQGLESRIRFLGFRHDVPELLPCCDVLVAPTRYEAYGLGVHEALCCGVPALVSKSAGVAEQYPEALQDLLIADCDDAPALAAHLRNWREKSQHYTEVTRELAARLRLRTWDVMAEEMVAMIAEPARC